MFSAGFFASAYFVSSYWPGIISFTPPDPTCRLGIIVTRNWHGLIVDC